MNSQVGPHTIILGPQHHVSFLITLILSLALELSELCTSLIPFRDNVVVRGLELPVLLEQFMVKLFNRLFFNEQLASFRLNAVVVVIPAAKPRLKVKRRAIKDRVLSLTRSYQVPPSPLHVLHSRSCP